MYKVLSDKVKFSEKLPERARRFEVLKQILLGKIYDNQEFEFHQERDDAKRPIPLANRAPAVDVGLGLIRNTVDLSISFVFGERRFPDIDCDDQGLRDTLMDLIKETNLFTVMQDAMFWGSLGSAMVHVFVSANNRVHFKAYCTQFLTPKWFNDEPDLLESVTEKYIVTGEELIEMGYRIDEKKKRDQYWFQRVWDSNSEIWYHPWPVIRLPDDNSPPRIDDERTVHHRLGFVPCVWLRNLKGGDEIDGACTFHGAIKSCIEIDYLISQGDRGLKYMADPTLVIVNPVAQDEDIFKSAASAIVLDKDGDAKILEMKGSGHDVVLNQVKALRESALEAMCGNRSSPDKMSMAQSGIALEHLWMPMIMLAGDLRNNYGEKGLLELLDMVTTIGSKRRLRIMKELVPLMDEKQAFALRWGRYFEPTLNDLQQQAVTIAQLITSGVMSQATAVKMLATDYAIENVDAELAAIKVDLDAQDARTIKVETAIQPKPTPIR